jgi:dolichol kinase
MSFERREVIKFIIGVINSIAAFRRNAAYLFTKILIFGDSQAGNVKRKFKCERFRFRLNYN